MSVGIEATLHTFILECEHVNVTCLSYHLPSVTNCQISTQPYPVLSGGHSVVVGDKVITIIDHTSIHIPINDKKERFEWFIFLLIV